MAEDFFSLGEPLPDLNPEYLTQEVARRMLRACVDNRAFKVIELRRLTEDDGGDLIIIECINDQVPSRNLFGIKVRERLALVFFTKAGKGPEVRALRKGFPATLHLNNVPPDQPASLCLYFEPWSATERTWTPQKHLQRILWWLSETAKGTLHLPDQPAERVYYDAGYELVLPPNFHERLSDRTIILVLYFIKATEDRSLNTLRAKFEPKGQPSNGLRPFVPLVVTLDPVVHHKIEIMPVTLGQLDGQMQARGVSFAASLHRAIYDSAEGGVQRTGGERCLLILRVPIKRTADSEVERHELRGFLLNDDLPGLGMATGTLHEISGRFFRTTLLPGTPSTADRWRQFSITPIDVRHAIDKAFARTASGVDGSSADFKGLLAGLGALGSTMAEIWARQAWGEWTLIDPDCVRVHNIARHAAKDVDVGKPKVHVVKRLMESTFCNGYYNTQAVIDSAVNWSNIVVWEAVEEAALIVDATTTLYVPRELARHDDAPRSVSVFLTPSARGSVLLLEDSARCVRLDSLEAQYYRAVMRSDWGATHLEGPKGSLWVGVGCRDVSAVLSSEAVLLHAATLASQVRQLRAQPSARIRVWNANHDTGNVVAEDVPVYPTFRKRCGEWTVVWDAGTSRHLSLMRSTCLPNETGGIIVGYVDHKSLTIYVVDVWPPPPDSVAERTGFIRGVDGLTDKLEEVARRTNGIVQYIGDWHSHPPFASVVPSGDDQKLIKFLSDTLANDGQPALMIIVGAHGEPGITVRDSTPRIPQV